MMKTTLAALLLASLLAAPAAAQHVAVDDCGIVIRETPRSENVRTSEGCVVRLRTRTNVVVFKPKAGHLVACWV